MTMLTSAMLLALAAGNSSATRAPDAANRALVVTSYEFTFKAPDSVESGIVTVTLFNRGKLGHQVVLARLDDSASMSRVMRTLVTDKKRSTGIHWVGGVENALPGRSSEATLSLAPGRYVLVCSYPDDAGHAHVSMGMIRPLIVIPSRTHSDAVLPAARMTIRLSDYRFDLSTPLIAGTQRVRVENNGPHRHHLTIGRVIGDATLAEIDKWDGKTKPAPIEDIGAGAAVLDPGQASVITLTLKPGRYVLACVLTDSSVTKPHYLLGMETVVVVR